MDLRHWITKTGKLPRVAGGAPAGAARIVVLEEGAASPSGDYLLAPHLLAQGPPVLRLDSSCAPTASALQAGDFVVVLRYLPARWRQALERVLTRLHGLAWFLDDDVLRARALAELPPPYARKLDTLARSQQPWFERVGAQWWVSTPALATAYARHQPQLLALAPLPALRPHADGAAAPVRIVYHGSASHAKDLAWLLPVLAQVQAACNHTQVELVGDHAVYRQARALPRTSVLHPMRWPAYLAHTQATRADIGLAPLLPSAFNAGRGAVKFYDYARMGALGVFSDTPPYQGFVRDGVDGLLLPNQPARWAQTLIALASDAPRRAALAAAAVARARG